MLRYKTLYIIQYFVLFFFLKDIKEACCKEVLIYVAKELDNDWYQFLMILTDDRNLIEEMNSNNKSGKENLMDFFESIAFQLKWVDLKHTLHSMEKKTLVDHIEKNFLYTQGKINKKIKTDFCNF